MDKIPQDPWEKAELALHTIPSKLKEPGLTAGALMTTLKGYYTPVRSLFRQSSTFAQLWGHDGSKCETSVRRLIDERPQEEMLSRALLVEIGQRFWGVRSAFESTRFWVEGLTLDSTTFDISNYLSDGRAHFGRKHKNVHIDFALDEAIAVNAHAGTLGNLVDNMVKNSLEHSGANSIWIAASSLGDNALITVEDDGSGIPTELRDKVLNEQRFSSRSSGVGGLGLLCVRDRLASFGASIEYQNRVGGGASFRMKVPIANS
jgi:signal transduction histidine kinase